MFTVSRYHDFSYGHRVCGHETKCKHLHGHNGRVHFTATGAPDSIGRVIDFGALKTLLCAWVENTWDHRMLIYQEDPLAHQLLRLDPAGVCLTSFNPTAELMAHHLLHVVGPAALAGTGVRLISVRLDETRKCSAAAFAEPAFDGEV